MVRVIAGVDPGKFGGIAFHLSDTPNTILVFDMPIAGGEVDGNALNRIVERFAPQEVWIERVHSLPTDGVASSFAFGYGCGVVRGVFDANQVRIERVTPTTWKKHFGLSKDKEESRAMAIRKFPVSAEQFARKKDHGKAEAALIALFGTEQRRD